jgi:hypothetical protein
MFISGFYYISRNEFLQLKTYNRLNKGHLWKNFKEKQTKNLLVNCQVWILIDRLDQQQLKTGTKLGVGNKEQIGKNVLKRCGGDFHESKLISNF